MSDLPSLNLKLDDPPPAPPPGEKKRGGRPKGSKNKAKGLSDVELRKALEQALVFPAVPAMIFYPTVEGKQYLPAHFTLTAPWGAEQLVMASKLSPPLRAQLERLARGGVAGIMLNFLAVWLGGPLLFLIGQKAMAEGVTMSSQVDEAGAAQAMQQMFSNMMGGMEGSDSATVNDQNGGQTQPETQQDGPPEPSPPIAEDWEQPQPESGQTFPFA